MLDVGTGMHLDLLTVGLYTLQPGLFACVVLTDVRNARRLSDDLRWAFRVRSLTAF